jgi:predicted nucleotide-binding protein
MKDGEGRTKMNEAQKQQIIGELKDFYKELKSYKRLLNPKEAPSVAQRRYRDSLREKLVGKAGALKSLVIQLTGKEHISRFGMVHNIWDVGLTAHRASDICDVALDYCIDAVTEAIGRLGTTPPAELELQEISVKEPPKAFIAHGGDSPALRKLKGFLEALGVQPLVVEEQPSEGRSIAENVDYYARQSDFAIILATKGDVDGKTGGFIPRGNVLMEIGKLQEILKDRMVYLLQAGTKLPTDISEKVRERFTPQSMDNAFIKVAKELTKFGILKAAKP